MTEGQSPSLQACAQAGLLAGVAALAAPSALAQADETRTLREITVIQRTPLPGFDMPAARYPGHAQQATDADIERAGAGTLPEFLARRLPGVSASDVQGNPFQLEISYRGQRLSPLLGAAQGLSLYLDGVRMNLPFGDVVHWEMIPEAAIAGVALVPGSNPLYGLNTLAGALVLTTKSGLTHPGTEAEFSVGSHGRQRLDFGHGRNWGEGWHAYAAGTAFREDGWRQDSPGRFGNVYFKLGREQPDVEWTASLLHGRSRLVGNSLVTDGLFAADRHAIYTSPDITRSQETLFALQGSRRLGGDARITLQAWHRLGRRDGSSGDVSEAWGDWLQSCENDPSVPACSDPSNPGFVGPAAVINRSRSRHSETGLEAQWTARSGAHQLALGVEAAAGLIGHKQFVGTGLFDAQRRAVEDNAGEVEQVKLRGRTTRVSLFAADAIDLSRATQLSVAARWDRTRVRNALGQPEPMTDEAFSYRKLNPSLGITHVLAESTTLFASASQGTRVPTALELGCADPLQPCVLPTGLQADPFLRQVVSRTLEAGLRWRPVRGLSAVASVFRTDNRDDIVFVRSGVSQAGFFVNVDKTRRQGLELALQGRQAPWDWSLGYTFLQATYQAEGVLPGPLSTDAQPNRFHPGTRIAGLPRHVLQLAADWRALPRLVLGADLQASSGRVVAGNESGDRPELGRIAGHALVHARARWQVDERWEVFLRIHNLFDRRYATAGAGNLDFFPGGRAVLPPDEPAAARFIAPGAPRTLNLGVRYAWDR